MNDIVLKNNLSDHFTLISYPDGQNSIKLNMSKLNVKLPVNIKCRIKNFGELEVLCCLSAALKKNDFFVDKIYFSYLFGMRSDRAFNIGEPNYFRDVIIPIIEPLSFSRVILCPHSVNYPIKLMVDDFFYYNHNDFENSLILGGDESIKINNLFGELDGYFIKQRKDKIIVDFKKNVTEKFENNKFENIIIIDDLCDGGETFIEEALYLKTNFPGKKLKLFICHALFTQGITRLLSYFDEIICTNSYQDINHPNVKQIKVI